MKEFDPNFTSCSNANSSPMHDLINSTNAIKAQNSFLKCPNPDDVMFDKAARRMSTQFIYQKDEGFNETNYE